LSNLSKYVEKYHHIKYSISITRITIKNIFILYEFGMYCLSFLSNKAPIIGKKYEFGIMNADVFAMYLVKLYKF
jgi:hypothetical protein